MVELFKPPTLLYLIIFLYFILYILFIWKKETKKKNTITVLFILLQWLLVYQFTPTMNSKSILSSLNADTIIVENEDINIYINADEIFKEESGIFMYKESLISRFQNFNEDSYFTLLFYKDDKLLIKMHAYKLEEETVYTGKINDTPIIIKWRGYNLKYNDELYENIENILG